ncbi:hypothetical protein F4604DRAFT_1991529 [Suillus subluteus]|nr:hypothetical protein F4604DRAFT_1991529 [Suillus subluteus]
MPTILNQESLKVLLALVKISTICVKCCRDLPVCECTTPGKTNFGKLYIWCFDCDINKFFRPPPGYISVTSNSPSPPLPSLAMMMPSDLITAGDGCAHLSCGVKKYRPPSKPHQDMEEAELVPTLEQALRLANTNSTLSIIASSPSVAQLDAEQRDYMRAVELSLQLNANTPSSSALPGPTQSRVCPQLTNNPSTEPKITTQLNATWMTMHKTDLSQRAQDQRNQDTKATCERRFCEHFFLVLWHLSDQPLLRQWISECPSWPYWSLDESDFLSDLLHGENLFKFFNFATMLWEPGHIDHVLSLTTQDCVFIRVAGTLCNSFQDCLDKATTAKAKPHMCTNLAGERNQVREDSKCSHKGKARELRVPTIEDTIILTDSNIDSRSCKRKARELQVPTIKDTIILTDSDIDVIDSSPLPLSSYLPLNDIEDPIDADALLVDTHPKLSHLSSPSHKAATQALAKKCENNINNIDWEMHPLPLCNRAWPELWYVVDMITGFKGMNNLVMKKHFPSSVDRFRAIFGTKSVTGAKIPIALADLATTILKMLKTIQSDMFQHALAEYNAHVKEVT